MAIIINLKMLSSRLLRLQQHSIVNTTLLNPFTFRLFSARVFVNGIPTHWDLNEIKTRFSIIPGYSEAFFVKNQEGQNTGKVIINY